LKNVLDSMPKGLNKCGTVSPKFHGFDYPLAANSGKFFQ